MRIEVIDPHGFCGGVKRAVGIAEKAVRNACGGRVYGLHEIVHNESVIRSLEAGGMVFVESVADIPDGATMLISAHGTSPSVFDEAERRGIRVIDATCPFVTAGHERIRENFRMGMRTAIVGKPTHVETLGYLGEPGACLPEDVKPGERTGVVVQTTLGSEGGEGVCTATRDRQEAVRRFVRAKVAEGAAMSAVGVLVIGSARSSNTSELASVAERAGARSWRVDAAGDVADADFSGIETLGVTAGASTPESDLQAVLERLVQLVV